MTRRYSFSLSFLLLKSRECEEIENYVMKFISKGQTLTIPRLCGDKEAFKLVLTNLIKNATQHTFRGIIKLISSYDEYRDVLNVAVLDTGAGMSKAQIENARLGMLGYQKRSATLTNHGTGLGLTVSHHLAKIYNGKVRIDSHQSREFSTIA